MDKKSKHYTAPDNYSDLGQMRTFTHIDHDIKPRMSFNTDTTDYKQFFKEYRNDLIVRITDCPAALCPWPFMDFTNRGEGSTVITWNTDMLIDAGMETERLRQLAVLLENAI